MLFYNLKRPGSRELSSRIQGNIYPGWREGGLAGRTEGGRSWWGEGRRRCRRWRIRRGRREEGARRPWQREGGSSGSTSAGTPSFHPSLSFQPSLSLEPLPQPLSFPSTSLLFSLSLPLDSSSLLHAPLLRWHSPAGAVSRARGWGAGAVRDCRGLRCRRG